MSFFGLKEAIYTNTEEFKELFKKIGFVEETNRIFHNIEEKINDLKLRVSVLEAIVANMQQKS